MSRKKKNRKAVSSPPSISLLSHKVSSQEAFPPAESEPAAPAPAVLRPAFSASSVHWQTPENSPATRNEVELPANLDQLGLGAIIDLVDYVPEHAFHTPLIRELCRRVGISRNNHRLLRQTCYQRKEKIKELEAADNERYYTFHDLQDENARLLSNNKELQREVEDVTDIRELFRKDLEIGSRRNQSLETKLKNLQQEYQDLQSTERTTRHAYQAQNEQVLECKAMCRDQARKVKDLGEWKADHESLIVDNERLRTIVQEFEEYKENHQYLDAEVHAEDDRWAAERIALNSKIYVLEGSKTTRLMLSNNAQSDEAVPVVERQKKFDLSASHLHSGKHGRQKGRR